MGGFRSWLMDARAWIVLGLSIALVVSLIRSRKRDTHTARKVFRVSEMLLIAILAVSFMFHFILGVFLIPSKSMFPTLQVGDRIFVNKFVYKFHSPRFRDVVVFQAPPEAAEGDKDSEDFIKRVIGVPGDTLEIKDGYVYRNGERLVERYIPEQMLDTMHTQTVEDGKLFVMGDNRNESSDSRVWGQLDTWRVIGRANMIFSPIKRLKYIKW